MELKQGNIQNISILENYLDFSNFYSSVVRRREKGPVLRTKADIWLLSAEDHLCCVTDPASPHLSVATASCKQSFVSQIFHFGISSPRNSGWILFRELLSCYLTQLGGKKKAESFQPNHDTYHYYRQVKRTAP